MSTTQRIQILRSAMQEAGLDAFFVSQPTNVYYLTGYQCRSWNLCQPADDPEAFALVQPDRLTFFCDDRHDPAPAVDNGAEHQRLPSPAGAAALAREIIATLGKSIQTVGFEAAALLHADAMTLLETVSRVRWQPADDLLVRQRITKDRAELDLLRRAARITDEAFAHVVQNLRPGLSEYDVADVINQFLRSNSDGCAFDTIVAFGPAAAAPHYHPSRKNILKKGDLVLMDFGAVWQGYHGDMTRTVFMGKADDTQRQRYEWVLEAQMAALAGLKPGLSEEQVDALARDRLAARGVADRFIHGTGHGIGLAIHEPPRLKATLKRTLEPGMVVTIEPGLYFDGWGGIRIEDAAIVNAEGCENITRSPKQLMEIPC
jgi:Xaa-Pro aminopeptidase